VKKITIFTSVILACSIFPWSATLAEETHQNIITSSEEQSVSSTQSSTESSSSIEQSLATVETEESTEATEATADFSNQNTNEVAQEQENPEVVQNEYGTFYSPRNRSDLHPTVRTYSAPTPYASLPTIAATNGNTPSKSFVDVSSHNRTISVDQYKTMKNYGVTGVVVKLTEATSYINPYAQSQINNAKAAGLKVSAYHYSWFTSTSEARAEADYFVAAAKKFGLSASTIMVNDIEEPQIAGLSNHTNDSKAFENRIKELGYSNVKHYVGLYWLTSGRVNASQLGYKNIWVAAYPYSISKNNLYQEYGAWQWSSQLTFPNISGYFDISADYTGVFSYIEPTPPTGTVAMYRLYNPNNYEHLYTQSANERNKLVEIGWGQYEGIAWYAPTSGKEVYRLYNKTLRDHHYTTDRNEVNVLSKKHGWTYEGVAWYSDNANKTTPIYRLFNPTLTSGAHHFTKDKNEVNVLQKRGWIYEGIAWYGK
jgi:GH25 family lysozyme M1 (1,4-beta-N-acetylmuramidase)